MNIQTLSHVMWHSWLCHRLCKLLVANLNPIVSVQHRLRSCSVAWGNPNSHGLINLDVANNRLQVLIKKFKTPRDGALICNSDPYYIVHHIVQYVLYMNPSQDITHLQVAQVHNG